jgi:hypothetical protein
MFFCIFLKYDLYKIKSSINLCVIKKILTFLFLSQFFKFLTEEGNLFLFFL